jgi:hypothetical protein
MKDEQIRALIVRGTDTVSGQPAEIVVRLATLADAQRFALSRGISVRSIHTETGTVFEPTSDGGFRKTHSEGGRPAGGGDGLLLALALLIPLLGFLVAAIRLANRDSSGISVLIMTIIGNLMWGVIFVLMVHGA